MPPDTSIARGGQGQFRSDRTLGVGVGGLGVAWIGARLSCSDGAVIRPSRKPASLVADPAVRAQIGQGYCRNTAPTGGVSILPRRFDLSPKGRSPLSVSPRQGRMGSVAMELSY